MRLLFDYEHRPQYVLELIGQQWREQQTEEGGI